MLSQNRLLFYIAGDVSGYNVVKYIYGEKSDYSFFTAHFFYKILSPIKVISLLPDIW
ncbi:CRISPR-associated protein DxTHG [Saccharolobus solfataricus]|nr:CRISPR-associated protein DxTHG [Saccharolobus solfataricus]QPG48927.1 hypothetical protein HFC64_02280 [Saccharolobus solfataricus]